MRVLHLNSSDSKGGAARAAVRLHRGLLSIGVESNLWTQHHLEYFSGVHSSSSLLERGISPFRAILDSQPLRLYPHRERKPFSPAWVPNSLKKIIGRFDPEIVHLHWTCGGFIPIQEIGKLSCPVVWTLHDMWPFTGGCHYSGECKAFTAKCGQCPQLHSRRDYDLSRWIWRRKFTNYRKAGTKLHIVAPSNWMKNQASESSLFGNIDIQVLPNALDCTYFRPSPRDYAKKFFGLNPLKKVVLCGDDSRSNPRKGFGILKKALLALQHLDLGDSMQLVVFGVNRPVDFSDLNIEAKSLGRFLDEASLALLYSAADVFVSAATEEALGYTIMEALACGTPAVAFNLCGIPDLIKHHENGYLAEPNNVEDLARGIAWVLEDSGRNMELGRHGAAYVANRYESGRAAAEHLTLYGRVTSQFKN